MKEEQKYDLTGTWIEEPNACNGDLMVRCSACGRMFREGVQIGRVRHFCPNCGAKMQEAQT